MTSFDKIGRRSFNDRTTTRTDSSLRKANGAPEAR